MTGTELAVSCIPGIVAGVISGIFGGGMLGPWRQHKLAERREKVAACAARKRVFLGFMAQFQSEVKHGIRPQGSFAIFYTAKIPNLEHGASQIDEDFSPPNRKRFKELVSAAILTGAQADKGERADGKQEIAALLDAISKFVENQ